MADNVMPFTRPLIRVPARWREHADALSQIRSEIDALRVRLEQERRDLLDVMKADMSGRRPFVPEGELKAMATASWHLDKGVRDALTLLECASERVSYATPADYDFEFLPPNRSDAS